MSSHTGPWKLGVSPKLRSAAAPGRVPRSQTHRRAAATRSSRRLQGTVLMTYALSPQLPGDPARQPSACRQGHHVVAWATRAALVTGTRWLSTSPTTTIRAGCRVVGGLPLRRLHVVERWTPTSPDHIVYIATNRRFRRSTRGVEAPRGLRVGRRSKEQWESARVGRKSDPGCRGWAERSKSNK